MTRHPYVQKKSGGEAKPKHHERQVYSVGAVNRARTRSEIAEIVAQFADSGLSRSEFCRRHDPCLNPLNRHLKRMRASKARPSDGLVAVQVV